MKSSSPQLTLRLEAVAALPQWCNGAALAYLGRRISLQLDTARKEAALEGAVLHLPLPPEATARQIRDAAQVWLRREAQRVLGEVTARIAAANGRPPPALVLSFAAKSSWARPEGAGLRCDWRLIEQSPAVIEKVLARAIAVLSAVVAEGDLFSAAA